jgi:hypothetical protein
MPGRGQYNIDTDMLQLQVGGRRGTLTVQLSRLHGQDAKENVAESTSSLTTPELSFAAALRSNLSRPQLHRPAWTANKYQVSQFRLLKQTVRL